MPASEVESTTIKSPPRITAAVLAVLGLLFLCGGIWLAALGGSYYYALAGISIMLAGWLLWRGNTWAERVYALMLIATLLWALWEAGMNPWALSARVLALSLIGFWLASPQVRRRSSGTNPSVLRSAAGAAAALAIFSIIICFAKLSLSLERLPVMFESNPVHGEKIVDDNWSNYGHGLNGTRFSPDTQIAPGNVGQLQIAWIHRTGGPLPERNISEATPIKIDDSLYTCTSHFVIISMDAKTGVERWRFDPHVSVADFPHATCRGVSFYREPDRTVTCADKVITTSPDGKLRALNATTGRPCANFGDGGTVSLLEDLGAVKVAYYLNTSPPTVVKGHIIIGGLIYDSVSTNEPSGVIRSFDPTTGALQWAWDMGAPERVGPPPSGQTYTRSTPNAWPSFAADELLGLVFLPMGNPSPDFYGPSRRPFDEKYGSAVVALDIANGRPKWSFQTTHHDLWDYDLPAQPVLVDLPGVEGAVPVVIQATKRGDFFVLDRRDGHPIVPAPERAVPTRRMPEEPLSKTQPISNLSLIPPPLTEASMWGLTPIDMLACRISFHRARYDGIFTAPGLDSTIEYPGAMGTVDWGGVTVDTDRQVLVANTTDFPFVVQLVPRAEETNPNPPYPQKGTPYVLHLNPLMGPLQIPCVQPPWGRLVAIDLQTKKILWSRELGTARDSGPFGFRFGPPLPVGTPNAGGAMTTRTGLIFIAATMDRFLRAFDIRSGRELWRSRLPAGAQAMPMSYMAGGKQFVVITAAGSSIIGSKIGDYTIAYALPDATKRRD
jgi:quinoprotein glucose dehydrogenase